MPEEMGAPEHGGGIGAFISRKVGPLPLWGWAVLAGGGALLWSRRHAAAGGGSATGGGQVIGSQPAQYSGGQGDLVGADAGSVLGQLQGAVTQQTGQIQQLQQQQSADQQYPNDPATQYIVGLFQSILHRTPDTGTGLDYWRSIYATQGPQAVWRGIYYSPEAMGDRGEQPNTAPSGAGPGSRRQPSRGAWNALRNGVTTQAPTLIPKTLAQRPAPVTMRSPLGSLKMR